jgi:SEFIR domain
MPSVFISYSHDSGHHVDRVLALADQLRADSIDVRLDQYEPAPPAGWPAWMQQQVSTTDFVVLVCTPTFRRRFDREEAPGEGLGATWEGMLAQQLLYEAGARNHRLLPVVFEDADPKQDIPLSLRAYTHYRLVAGYEELLRRITNQPRRSAPPLGQPRVLAPDPRPSLFGGGLSVDNRNANIGQVVNVGGNATFGAMTITIPAPTPQPVPAPVPMPAPQDTILLFTANAVDPTRRLELEEELRAILDALKRSRTRDRFAARISPSVTFTTVIHDVDDHAPAIVHFGGHGHHHGELILRGDEEGSERRIAPEHIATLLSSVHTPPTLVVFATCYSEALAAAAAEHVPYAIGFHGEVQDRMLPRFSAALYERLAARPALDVPHAFRLAKLAVAADGFITAEQACLFERHPSHA